MGFTSQILDDVRAQLAPDDAALKEAKERRDRVRRAAESFPGASRSFASGSLAHATANCPVHHRDKGLDADTGVVLDRRSHSTVGPDSPQEEGPAETVKRMVEHLRARLTANYPKATFKITKRAILIEFHEPRPTGEDPTVDLVVSLERRYAPGLWIPNTQTHTWDASHPEKHTELLTANPKTLRVTRARVIRLAKAENKRAVSPPLCSFNLEALGWMFVTAEMDEPTALLTLWTEGARDLEWRLTPDPAGVSAPIKVADRTQAVSRLRQAAGQLALALQHDDDERQVRAALQPLWPEFIAPTAEAATKARAAARLKTGSSLSITGRGALSTTAGLALKSPRSFGHPR